MAQTLNADSIDFAGYLRDTEGQQRVKPAGLYVQELIDSLGKVRVAKDGRLPWAKTHEHVEFRPGEVTVWAGVNGQGKSLVTGMVALSLGTQGEKVCIASFEMRPKETMRRLLRQWSGRAFPTTEELGDPMVYRETRDLAEQFRDWTNAWLWLYDQQGTTRSETVLGVARYCAKELGIRHVFIDNLAKCLRSDDDNNEQKAFVDDLTALARDYDVHVHLVHHSKKLARDEDVPQKGDVKGSGTIVDQVDNLMLVWRNKRKERDAQAGKLVSETEPDALLICDKQRNGDWEGRISLWFDAPSQQFRGGPNAKPLNFFNFPHRETAS